MYVYVFYKYFSFQNNKRLSVIYTSDRSLFVVLLALLGGAKHREKEFFDLLTQARQVKVRLHWRDFALSLPV